MPLAWAGAPRAHLVSGLKTLWVQEHLTPGKDIYTALEIAALGARCVLAGDRHAAHGVPHSLMSEPRGLVL